METNYVVRRLEAQLDEVLRNEADRGRGLRSPSAPAVVGPIGVGKRTLARRVVGRRTASGSRREAGAAGPRAAFYDWPGDRQEIVRDFPATKKTSRPAEPAARAGAAQLVFHELQRHKGWESVVGGILERGSQRILLTSSAEPRPGKTLAPEAIRPVLRLHPITLTEWLRLPVPELGWREEPAAAGSGAARSPRLPAAMRQQALGFLAQWQEASRGPAGAVGRRVPRLVFPAAPAGAAHGLDALMRFSGFAAPLLQGTEEGLAAWQRRADEQLFEQLREGERLRCIDGLRQTAAWLPHRLAAPQKVGGFARKLAVSPHSVAHWLEALVRNQYGFAVSPWQAGLPRERKKDRKYYLWDWTLAKYAGQKFENLCAVHLMNACHYWTGRGDGKFTLHFAQNAAGQEIDLLVARNDRPWLLVECKYQPGYREWEMHSIRNMVYYLKKLKVEQAVMVTFDEVKNCDQIGEIQVVPATKFLAALP